MVDVADVLVVDDDVAAPTVLEDMVNETTKSRARKVRPPILFLNIEIVFSSNPECRFRYFWKIRKLKYHFLAAPQL